MLNSHRELEDALWEWADGNTPNDCKAIWQMPNAPRPGDDQCVEGEPYVSLRMISVSTKPGQDSWLHDNDESWNIGGQRMMTLSVVAYGPSENRQQQGSLSAFQIMKDLRNSLENPNVLLALRRSGIAVHNEPVVSDISTLLETGFQDRSNMDIVFGFAHNQVIPVGALEIVGVKACLEGSKTHESEFEIE